MNTILNIFMFQALLVVGIWSFDPNTFVCKEQGNFPIDNKCNEFINCYKKETDTAFTKQKFMCGIGAVFDPSEKQCVNAGTLKNDPCAENNDNEHKMDTNDINNKCKKGGFFGDPKDCQKFYQCERMSGDNYKVHEHTCGENLVFDPSIFTCNHKWAVKNLKCETKQNSNESPKAEVEHLENGEHTANIEDKNGNPASIQNEQPIVGETDDFERATEDC